MDMSEGSNTWRSIVDEYKRARLALEQLVENEEGTIRTQAEELVVNLDNHFHKLEDRMQRTVVFDLSLASPLPPPIDRHNLKGILAYRAWNMQIKGFLSPSIMSSNPTWDNELAFADTPPHTSNHNGLHAMRLENWESNRYQDFVSGVVDLYGKVIEHEDGVLRAECARIACLLVTVTSENQVVLLITGLYELLRHNYPNTLVYPVSPYQKKLFLWREVLVNYRAIPTIIEMNRERRSIW